MVLLSSFLFQRKEVVSQTACSGFMVEFEDVKSKAEEEPLHGDIAFSAREKPSEMHVLFGHGKGTLRLDGAADAQETALLGGDAQFGMA